WCVSSSLAPRPLLAEEAAVTEAVVTVFVVEELVVAVYVDVFDSWRRSAAVAASMPEVLADDVEAGGGGGVVFDVVADVLPSSSEPACSSTSSHTCIHYCSSFSQHLHTLRLYFSSGDT